MFKKTLVLVSMFVSASATVALAGSDKDDGGKGGFDNTRAVSFEELRARCANPKSFDIQAAPEQIVLQCKDVHRDWVASEPGQVALPGFRHVFASLFSTKFHVGTSERAALAVAQPGSCLRFKEVESVITIERALTCADVLSLKTDLDDFCLGNLDLTKEKNPKLVSTHDTGNVVDTCAGVPGVVFPGKGGGK